MATAGSQFRARRPRASGRSGRLRTVAIAVPSCVVLAGGLGSAVERHSLLLAGAMLLGWSQLVGP